MKKYTANGQQLHQALTELVEPLGTGSGFVQRRSKLTSTVFAQAFVLGCLETPTATLNTLVQVCEELGVTISESGFQQRIDAEAVVLLRQLFEAWMGHFRQQGQLNDTVLQPFCQVNVLDSSEIMLPVSLQALFPGKQGAALKVQLNFDYLSGTFNALEVTPARLPDQSCPLLTAAAPPGSLNIFDLGYFDQRQLAQLDTDGAYFVTRLQDQVALYALADGQRLPLETLLEWLPGHRGEWMVALGANTRLPVRLIAERLPETVVAARRRKAHAKAKRWGKTCSHRQLALLAWNMWITNVPSAWLSAAQVRLVYTVRWQIELLFKVCKSQAALDQIGHWQAARLQCQLYARLLGVALFHGLVAPWRFDGQELSLPKAFRCLQRRVAALTAALVAGPAAVATVLTRLIAAFRRFATKTQRRKRPSTYQQLRHAA